MKDITSMDIDEKQLIEAINYWLDRYVIGTPPRVKRVRYSRRTKLYTLTMKEKP